MKSLTCRSLLPSQNNYVHGQPYTGPAAHHLNKYQKSDQRTQESDEGNEDVSSSQMRDQ